MEQDIVIDVKNISKKYTIATDYQPDTLREKIVELAKYPLRAFRGHHHKPKTKEYWALNDLSFQVKRGEVLGIIGKNGAGKSTLLKILSRITEPTSGSIMMKGRVASLLEVGTGFNPELTGRENIYLNGAIIGMSKKEIATKFREIVEFSGIGEFLDTPVKRYSSGMYVRLAFAVAAHLDSDILLLDEVLAVGDVEFQKKCLQKIEQMVREESKTVIFISHNIPSIKKLCNRIIYIEHGKINIDTYDIKKAIDIYTDSQPSTQKLNYWISEKSKDNEWFTARKIFLTNNYEVTNTNFKYSDHITLHIEVLVHKLHDDIQVGYALYDAKTDQLLYWCSFNDDNEDKWPNISKGKIAISTDIPHQILNEGDYRVELIGAIHNQIWLYQPENNSPCITFSVAGGLPEHSLWKSYKPGFLAPLSKWVTKVL